MSIAQIPGRFDRSPATIKGYFYDPTGKKHGRSRARYLGVCRGLRRIHPAAQRQGGLRVLQGMPSRRDPGALDSGAGAGGDGGAARSVWPPADVLRLVAHACPAAWGGGDAAHSARGSGRPATYWFGNLGGARTAARSQRANDGGRLTRAAAHRDSGAANLFILMNSQQGGWTHALYLEWWSAMSQVSFSARYTAAMAECGGRCPIEAGVLGRMPPRPTPSRPDAAVRVLG